MQVNEYLVALPAQIRSKLMKLPHCCLAVFRSLGDAERYALLRLVSGPQPAAVLSSALIKQEKIPESGLLFARDSDQASKIKAPIERRLFPSLSLLKVVRALNGEEILKLDDDFSQNLKTALSTLDMSGLRGQIQSDEDLPPAPSQKFPGRFDKRTAMRTATRQKRLATLAASGLVSEDKRTVTHAGFQFLLSDIPSQIWNLIQSYIESQCSGTGKTDAIAFLIYLATLPSGKLFSMRMLTDSEKKLLTDWSAFGVAKLINNNNNNYGDAEENEEEILNVDSDADEASDARPTRPATSSAFFCITPLAWQIVSSQREGLAGGTEIGKWKRGIIVESNFFLYAYTDSVVLVALLDLFSEVTTRLPNLCISKITRRSARDAFRRGIKGEQIIRYLQQNRHSVHLERQRNAAAAAAVRMLDRDTAILMGDDSLLRLESSGGIVGTDYDPTGSDGSSGDDDHRIEGLPEQVVEQILLWEEERTRFRAHEGYLYDDFDSRSQYVAVEKYARDLGVLLWSNPERMAVFVQEGGHDAMKAYIRKQSQNTQ